MDSCVFLNKYPLVAIMITYPHVYGAPISYADDVYTSHHYKQYIDSNEY